MESLKKLKDVAEECLKDIKAIDSKTSIAEGNLSFLESKKTTLGAEILDLESRKSAVMELVGRLEKDARNEIESKMREVKAKEEYLESLKADLKIKLFQAEASNKDSLSEKEKYAALYAEYTAKLAELEAKKRAIQEAAQ